MEIKNINRPFVAAVLILGVLVIGLFFAFNRPMTVEGGSLEGDYATTTLSTSASATAKSMLKNAPGALGNVVISSSSPVTVYPLVTIYDATSTMATSTSRILARFGGVNQQHGTYIFDAAAIYGIAVEVPVGFDGAYTITWR